MYISRVRSYRGSFRGFWYQVNCTLHKRSLLKIFTDVFFDIKMSFYLIYFSSTLLQFLLLLITYNFIDYIFIIILHLRSNKLVLDLNLVQLVFYVTNRHKV